MRSAAIDAAVQSKLPLTVTMDSSDSRRVSTVKAEMDFAETESRCGPGVVPRVKEETDITVAPATSVTGCDTMNC